MLKSLETLDISGCSNLEEFQKQIGNLQSLTVLNLNGITIIPSLSTGEEVKAWHSFMQPQLLNPRKPPEISWAALPRSLAKLSLENCNLSDDVFPRDLSNLSSLQFLNLSDNPIQSLPDFIRGLTGLQNLCLKSCTRLQSFARLPKIEALVIGHNTLLEKVNFLSNSFLPQSLHIFMQGFDNLVEFMGEFKLEPIGKVDVEIVNNLGFSILRSRCIPSVKLYSSLTHTLLRKLPLQGCHEENIFCVYLPGSKVPPWFNVTNIGSSISFAVPSLLNFRIQGLCVCSVTSVYEICNDHNHAVYTGGPHTIISNATKSLVWSHYPWHFGIPEADENMIWLSYWKFENQLEGGDELNVSVVGPESFQVKEVRVRILYKEEQEKSIQIQSIGEAVASQQTILYGNVVPGTVSARPAGLNIYRLGTHFENCRYCPLPCGGTWTLDDPKSQ